MKILTIGTFDIPHLGHYNFIRKIKELFPNSELYVSVNSDDFIERFKGKKPIFTQEERMSQLTNIEGITVIKNNGDELAEKVIDTVYPDVLVIGSDWARKDYLKQLNTTQDYLDNKDISLVYIPYTRGISTTEIKRRIRQ